MGLIRSTILALSVASSVLAQCDAPSVTTQYGATRAIVGSGTLATILQPTGGGQTITVTSCGQATVAGRASATLAGGTIFPGGGTTNNQLAFATISVIGPNNLIAQGVNAQVQVAASATVTARAVERINFLLLESASADVSAGYVYLDARQATATVTATAGGEVVADSSDVDMTINGVVNGDIYAQAYGPANLRLRGAPASAEVYNGAQITMYGSGHNCYILGNGFCTASGSMQTFTADSGGYAEMIAGASNTLVVLDSGTGVIGGEGSRATASPGGNLQVRAGGQAEVQSYATATVSSANGPVTVFNLGIATLYPGATVLAAPFASLRVISPMTSVVSVGEEGPYTIYAARAAASGQQADRRSLPVPTGRCGAGHQYCPNLRGRFGCVDITNDIFNCGGCALSSDKGVDCTESFASGVKCVAGQCVAA